MGRPPLHQTPTTKTFKPQIPPAKHRQLFPRTLSPKSASTPPRTVASHTDRPDADSDATIHIPSSYPWTKKIGDPRIDRVEFSLYNNSDQLFSVFTATTMLNCFIIEDGLFRAKTKNWSFFTVRFFFNDRFLVSSLSSNINACHHFLPQDDPFPPGDLRAPYPSILHKIKQIYKTRNISSADVMLG